MDLNSILYGGQANPQMSTPGVPAVPSGVLAGLQPQAPQMSMMVPQDMPAPEGVETVPQQTAGRDIAATIKMRVG